jgi:Outer membrane protein beta-barrel domain
MRQKYSDKIHTAIPLLILAFLVLLAQPTRNAVAEDLLGLYVGGAIGQSHVESTGQTTYALGNVYYDTGSFRENHFAFKGMVGIRPISLLGAEVGYTDFGHPSGAFNAYPADESMKGVSAFGVLYLPVPIVDVFLKAGVARIQSELNGTGHGGPNCSANGPCPEYVFIAPFQLNRTNTGGAGGVGAQYKYGSFAVRAEYERFNAAGGNPSLLSVGVTWTFF